jgi:hypothetical protein
MRALTKEGREFAIGQDALDTLRTRLRGPVLTPGDAGYEESRTVWNAMIDRRPAAVARCLGVADVLSAVRVAREHELAEFRSHGFRGEPCRGAQTCRGRRRAR